MLPKKRFTSRGIFCFAFVAAAATAEPVVQSHDTKGPLVNSMAESAIMQAKQTVPKKPDMVILPSALDFSMAKASSFLDAKRYLVQRVEEAKTGLSTSKRTTNALLGLAELYLSHAMIVESISILAALDPEILSPENYARAAGISMALNTLNPLELVVSDAQIKMLEGAEKWPNHALERALYTIRKGDKAAAGPFLAAAATDLAALPASLHDLALPELLDTAIDLNNWAAAKEFAMLFTRHKYLQNSSAYAYLLGRVAENGGDYLVAFDKYIKASAGQDQWAHMARLSMIEMGLKTKTLGPQDAHKLLLQIRFAWRGDTLAIRTLTFLADTEMTLHNVADALEVLGEVIYIDLNETATLQAKEQADYLLNNFYGEGASGKIEVSRFMREHVQIAPDYRFQHGFGKYSEQYADRLLEVGVSDEAAREYEATYNYLSVSQELGLFDVPLGNLDRLRLKQAKALLRGGQYEAAMSVLAYGAQGEDLAVRDEFTFLKMELFNFTGDSQAILEENAHKPSTAYLRIKAKAHFALEDWKTAKETYKLLWEQQGEKFQFTDALNMLLSAYREQDIALALELIQLFPNLTDAPQWHEIATGLFKEKKLNDILNKDALAANISNAGRVLDVMEIINTSSQNEASQ